jgi:hypothetical protein
MATVGQVLASPEAGWKRYDNSGIQIKYSGSGWSQASSASFYNSTYNACDKTSLNGVIQFKFYGTKLRILSDRYSGYADLQIDIDGVVEQYTQKGSSAYIVLLYEKSNLANTTHVVTISKVNAGTYATDFTLDAIDVDDIGYLMHPILPQKQTIDNMVFGDCISCRYTNLTSGGVGYFSELGTCNAPEIPLTGTATPDGLFYFILAGYDASGKLKLIPDRILQHSVAWDTLNLVGITSGVHPTYFGTDLLKTATISSDSFYTGYPLENVRDGSLATQWLSTKASGTAGCFVKVVFDSPDSFENVIVSTAYGCSNFNLKYSDDDVNYYLVKSFTPALNTNNQILTVPRVGSHKYWKIDDIASTYGGANLGLTEFKMMKGLQSLFPQLKFNMRLMTGGILATDLDNEWDKVIVSNTLDGLITAGDNKIWNWSNLYTITNTIDTTNNTYRFGRGGGTLVDSRIQLASASAYTTAGFRPLLLVDIINAQPILDISSMSFDVFPKNQQINISGIIIDPDVAQTHTYKIENITKNVVIKDFNVNDTKIINYSFMLDSSNSIDNQENVFKITAKDMYESSSIVYVYMFPIADKVIVGYNKGWTTKNMPISQTSTDFIISSEFSGTKIKIAFSKDNGVSWDVAELDNFKNIPQGFSQIKLKFFASSDVSFKAYGIGWL